MKKSTKKGYEGTLLDVLQELRDRAVYQSDKLDPKCPLIKRADAIIAGIRRSPNEHVHVLQKEQELLLAKLDLVGRKIAAAASSAK